MKTQYSEITYLLSKGVVVHKSDDEFEKNDIVIWNKGGSFLHARANSVLEISLIT